MSKEDEINLVLTTLNHPAGFNLGFAGILGIRKTDQMTIEVEWEEPEGDRCQSFLDSEARAAVTFFVEKRHELRYGLDFEAIDMAAHAV